VEGPGLLPGRLPGLSDGAEAVSSIVRRERGPVVVDELLVHAAGETSRDTSESTRASDGGDRSSHTRRCLQQTRKEETSMPKLSTHAGRELAHRSSDGLDVTLVWVHEDGEDKAVVCVCDRREGAYFEIPAETHLAPEVYHHPFAYRDFSTVHYEDSRLAA
jgi:hypothetical protein